MTNINKFCFDAKSVQFAPYVRCQTKMGLTVDDFPF